MKIDVLAWLSQVVPVALRIGGFLMFGPFLGDRAIPNRIKAGLLVVMTALIAPVATRTPMVVDLAGWVRTVSGECIVGLMIGMALQSVFEAVQFAGQISGIQVGLSLATLFDPQSNSESTALPVFMELVTLLIFLQLNVHHWVLRALQRSFDYLPVGSAVITQALSRQVIQVVGALYVLGIQIAAPIILATLMIDVVTSFISKASPQLPAMLIGVPVKNLTGYALLISAFAMWPAILERRFAMAIGSAEKLLHLARGG